ncbi:MAG: transporter substrate-binding domain-containing protein, partial [Eggerthellaceae bacterium]|nr:transporter substrate-binding domain-containing protein [Eggerthellaceae bacterium]
MKKKFVAIVAVAAALVLCFGILAGCSSNSKAAKYTLLNETLQDEHFAVAFKLGDTDLANAINQGIANVDKDGTVKKLCEKYG